MSASGRITLGDLPPSSSVTRFSARARLRADLAADGRRPGEGDLVDVGMVDQRGPGLAVAREDVQHARREADLERELAEPQRAQRRLLGGLQHDRAARRQRRPELPGGHQQREVPGDDLPAHADRFAAGVAVHVRGRDGQHRRPRSSWASRRSSGCGRPRRRRRRTGPARRACRCPATRSARVPRRGLRSRRPARASAAHARTRASTPTGRSRRPRGRRRRRARRPRRRRGRPRRSRGRWPGRSSRMCGRRPPRARSAPISRRCERAMNSRAGALSASGRASAEIVVIAGAYLHAGAGGHERRSRMLAPWPSPPRRS